MVPHLLVCFWVEAGDIHTFVSARHWPRQMPPAEVKHLHPLVSLLHDVTPAKSNVDTNRLNKTVQGGNLASQQKAPSQAVASRRNAIASVCKKRLTAGHVVHLLRRLLVIASALHCVALSSTACLDSMRVLRHSGDTSMDFQLYKTLLMGEHTGDTTTRESPLLTAINFSTASWYGTLFPGKSLTAFTGCMSTTASPICQDKCQRKMFASLATSLVYNITALDPSTCELIMAVVDCALMSLVDGDAPSPRYFYLMRMVHDPDNVFLTSVVQSVLEY
ncbi:hypothetical protein FI667_g14374, partial [Globisporangium splendens]